MTKKLYYDDPLIAAYMAREFDVKFHTGGGDTWEILFAVGAFRDVKINKRCGVVDRIYIHPNSYSIFEPREGDYCAIKIECDIRGTSEIICQYQEIPYFEGELLAIVGRANKHFFMPKGEGDDWL